MATDRGVVAVDQETIAKQGLTETIVFPWDPTKRVYIVIAFHQLHCLVRMRSHLILIVSLISSQKLLYQTLTSVYNGEDLQKPVYEHCVHCLDQLRQDTECNADDVRIIKLSSRGLKANFVFRIFGILEKRAPDKTVNARTFLN